MVFSSLLFLPTCSIYPTCASYVHHNDSHVHHVRHVLNVDLHLHFLCRVYFEAELIKKLTESVQWKVSCLLKNQCSYTVSRSMTLCDPMDHSLPDFPVHGVLQARILEWLPCCPPGDLPNPGIEPRSLALQADSLLTELWGKPIYLETMF